MTENQCARIIVDVAYKVHRVLGPGLLESVYEAALVYELERRGLKVLRQHPIPVDYDGVHFDIGFRADILVEGIVLLELKSVESLAPVHKKQLLTYIKLANLRLGLLINFGADLIKNGIVRIANDLPEEECPKVTSPLESQVTLRDNNRR